MIDLIPKYDAPDLSCPNCQHQLTYQDWLMPGMRMLAHYHCTNCQHQIYADLPSGHGLYYRAVLDTTNETVDTESPSWFSEPLLRSYRERVNNKPNITFERVIDRDVKHDRPVIFLNCLDWLYGHSVLKLLNAQYYLDHFPQYDVIVLIQPFLRWMIPEGVAEIWTVKLPLRDGIQWNDGLAKIIREKLNPYQHVMLGFGLAHPHPSDVSIERFTNIMPFDMSEWLTPTKHITFIWREDRLWSDDPGWKDGWRNKWSNLKRKFRPSAIIQQRDKFLEVMTQIRDTLSDSKISVVGLGGSGEFPEWVTDLRTTKIDETVERQWCEQYARSHLVIGVHGSNMLLPTAHAACVINLMPVDRWMNHLQDTLITEEDARLSQIRYKYLPIDTSSNTVSDVAIATMNYLHQAQLIYRLENTNHLTLREHPYELQHQMKNHRV